jgi:F-type H+-transporting ATPase subunit delta
MIRDTAAKRYARAAFQVALERGTLDRWSDDVQLIAAVMGDARALALLTNTKVPLAERYRLLETTLAGIDPQAMNLAKLLVAKGRTGLAPQIAEAYLGLVDEHRGIAHATVITAVPLSDGEREAVEKRLGEMSGKQVIAHLEVEPSIVGGLVARIGDKVIDGSTHGKLLALKRSLAGQER